MGTIDKAWEEIHSSRDWGQYPSEHVIRFVARNYYNKKRDEVKILDFGIGGGLIPGTSRGRGLTLTASTGVPARYGKRRRGLPART